MHSTNASIWPSVPRLGFWTTPVNDILHIRLNDPDVAEVYLRPVVAEFLRTNKPRKEFDVDRVKKQSYHHGFFSEATVKVRKIQTASDAKFEGEVDFINEFYDHDKEWIIWKFPLEIVEIIINLEIYVT